MVLATNAPRLTPPQSPIRWDHSAELIKSKTDEEIVINRKLHDTIAALKSEDCSFESVFQALAYGNNRLTEATSPLIFYSNVATDDAIRNASIAAEKDLDEFGVEIEMRVDVYKSLLNAQKNTDVQKLTPEQKRLVEKMLMDGKRAGLSLPDDQREKLTKAS